MKRFACLAALALVAGCNSGEPVSLAALVLRPVLDTMYVGDSAPPRIAVYFNDQGDSVGPIAATWSSSASGIVGVNSVTGRLAGNGRGFAVLTATYKSVQGHALVVATRPLDINLLLDTIYLMPNDSFVVPVEVRKKGGGAPAPYFKTPTNAVFTIDSATGRIAAQADGGPIPFFVHADTMANSGVVDSGFVQVLSLSDTVGGKSYYTVLGTLIRRASSTSRAVNYTRAGGSLTFRLRDFINVGTQTAEAIVLTSLTPVLAGRDTIVIDSISPTEAFGTGFDPLCRPQSNWGLWSTRTVVPTLQALSRQGGSLVISQVVPLANGKAVSGWFTLTAQRLDAYTDPAWALPIRGTFVAPLITDNTTCAS